MNKDSQIIFRVTDEEKEIYNRLKVGIDFPKFFRDMIMSINGMYPSSDVNISEHSYDTYRIEECNRCRNSFIYFATKYVYIESVIKGRVLFSVRGVLEDLMQKMESHDNIIYLKTRQCGISTIEMIYVLWRHLFFNDHRILYISSNKRIGIHFMERLRYSYSYLPIWLKLEKSDKFSNLYCDMADTFIGDRKDCESIIKSYDEVIVDEGCYCNDEGFNNLVEVCKENAIKMKFFSTSKKGRSSFIDLYKDSLRTLDWVSGKIEWYDVNGRDTSWMLNQIERIGLEEFNYEFGCIYD